MMRDIADLLPRVYQKAPACPEPLAIRALLDAARTFLRRTRLWRLTDTYPVLASDVDGWEAFDSATDAVVLEIASAAFGETIDTDGDAPDDGDSDSDETQDAAPDGDDDDTPTWRRLHPRTIPWLDDHFPGWRSREGSPRYITQSLPGTFQITPQSSGTVKLHLILEPSEDATTLPDFVVDRYGPDIANGALADILTTPGDFANPQLAIYCKGEFDKAIDQVGSAASKGQQRAARRTRPAQNF